MADFLKFRLQEGIYWQRRYNTLMAKLLLNGEKEIAMMEQEYRLVLKELSDQIAGWYTRYATNEGISYAEAKRILDAGELAEFRMGVKKYIELGRKNKMYGGAFEQILERASIRVHVSRLEALQLQVQEKLERMIKKESDVVESVVKNTYVQGYYHSIYEIQKGVGIGATFFKLEDNLVDKVIHKPWTDDGIEFSERIWGTQRPKLVNTLHRELTKQVILGNNPRETAKVIEGVFKVQKSAAERLCRTETAYFANQSFKDTLDELGVDQYEISVTLDSRTTEICIPLDHKVFNIIDYKTGISAPPFHPNCRCTTVPHFNNLKSYGTRIAREKESKKSYHVPGNMSYEEWREKYPGDARPKTKNKK